MVTNILQTSGDGLPAQTPRHPETPPRVLHLSVKPTRPSQGRILQDEEDIPAQEAEQQAEMIHPAVQGPEVDLDRANVRVEAEAEVLQTTTRPMRSRDTVDGNDHGSAYPQDRGQDQDHTPPQTIDRNRAQSPHRRNRPNP